MNNAQGRKWTLVINNPLDWGFDHDKICEMLKKFFPDYFCLSDETAKTGTPHTHIFIYSKSPIRFSTLKGRFPTAHIEKAYGSVKENREYILKEGKWAESDKADTIIKGSFLEFGTAPDEQQEKSPQMSNLLNEIKIGKSTLEIIMENPNLAFRSKDIDMLRQTIKANKFSVENRDVSVNYVYGATNTGKTRMIYETHDAREINRITHYGQNGKGVIFDEYNYGSVLVFEEFHSQIPINEMLNYLDIYPLFLPARYNNKVACYTQVYITSNIGLFEQYPVEQQKEPETWNAFWRRINKIIEFTDNGIAVERNDLLWTRERKDTIH